MEALHPYYRVNALLNGVFFDGRFAGQPVYLTLDNEMRSAISRELGCALDATEDAICACVRSYLANGNDPYARLSLDMRAWRRGGMQAPPPCTAMLFCLSHAAAIMAADGEFASNNYYLRLAQITGLSRPILSGSRVATDSFWEGLSEWLLLNNHALGKPTARATNAWRYVGKAMSQAIVRASDRPHFHDLFEKFGFSGGEAITPRDMEQYLTHWMETAGATPRLKRVWRDATLHERVAEAAIAELHSWSMRGGKSVNGATARPLRMSLLANLVPGFPRPSLELHLGRVGETGQRGPFVLRSTTSSFFLANDLFGSIATLSPNPFAEGDRQLSSAIHLDASAKTPGMEWEPRLIIPLALHQQGNAWMEVARVGFAVQHMLLVRDANGLPLHVDRYLASACSTLPKKAVSGVDGLPQGWVLYQDVQVRQVIDPGKKELECLVPVSDDGALSIGDGLQLLPGFFHSSMPPKATFLTGAGPTYVHAGTIGNEEQRLASATSEEAECILDLNGLQFAGGVSVVGGRGGNDIAAREIFFRDARQPHPLSQDGRGRLAYLSLLSASQKAAGSASSVEGCTADIDSYKLAIPSAPAMSVGRVLEGASEDLQVARFAAPLAAHTSSQTCIERGYHVTVFPMVRPNTPAGKSFEGKCSDCKRTELIIYRRKREHANDEGAAIPRVELPSLQVPTAADVKPVDVDILMDALAFLGHGSWGKFQTLIDAWGGSEKHPRQVAHELFLLGHLDLEIRAGSNAVKSWCVPPPSVNFTTKGDAFLAGFRSQCLMAAVEAAVQPRGTLQMTSVQGQATRAWIEGLDPESLASALDEVRDPLGRRLAVNVHTAGRLSAACGLLEGIDEFLEPISIGRVRNLQRFDFSSVRWTDVKMALAEGAYRWNDGLQIYAYMNGSGAAVAAPYQVVKLLAARSAGVQLHHYDQSARTFVSTLGCEPPGLLERALVACSGELPALGRGRAIYKNVPQDIAAAILEILYPEDRLEHEKRKSHQRH